MKTLQKLCARDLMQTEVLRLSPEDPVQRAIELLEEHGVTGAPVEDSTGRLVGIFSNTDVARADHVTEGRIATDGRPVRLSTPPNEDGWEEEDEEADLMTMEDYGAPAASGRTPTVADWMSRKVVHVAPDAALKSVCATLARHSIHRVPVVEGGRVRGIVSALDVVECLARSL